MAGKISVNQTALPALLRENGFKGSAPTFRRFLGKDVVWVVNIQASASSGSYVNLGVHVKHLGKTDWEKISEYECAFRARLEDFAGGQRFFFDDAASTAALVEMMKVEGLAWFANFESERLPSTIANVAKEGWDKLAPLSPPAGPDTWARLARHFGDAASVERFKAQDDKLTREREAARERERANAEGPALTIEDYKAKRGEERARKRRS